MVWVKKKLPVKTVDFVIVVLINKIKLMAELTLVWFGFILQCACMHIYNYVTPATHLLALLLMYETVPPILFLPQIPATLL